MPLKISNIGHINRVVRKIIVTTIPVIKVPDIRRIYVFIAHIKRDKFFQPIIGIPIASFHTPCFVIVCTLTLKIFAKKSSHSR